ncbi:peptidase S9 [Sphingomonas sp. DBB INV C78]|uniref:alpha/beta hydrolase family protein n=1 Tax=Sphingomonas sp. DBB INV C78 TaxID=3349434 RepID=UPI0036D3C9F5
MKLLKSLFAGGILLCAPVLAQTPTATPEVAFGARESVMGAKLSPKGGRVSFLAPYKDKGIALYTVPVDGSTPPLRALVSTGEPELLRRCDWVSEGRLVCTVYSIQKGAGQVVGTTRMVALNIDGSDLKLVSSRDSGDARYFNRFGGAVIDWLPGQDNAVLVGRQYVPAGRLDTLIEKKLEGFGVERVDTLTLATKRIVDPARDANEYITDGLGTVRIKGVAELKGDGYTTGITRYSYRAAGSDDWRRLGDYNSMTEEGFNPYAVDPANDKVYGFLKKDGRKALVRRSLDGTLQDEQVFSRSDVDVDGLVRIGRKGRIVGVSFVTDRRQAVYFDEPLKKLAAGLGKALPNAPLVYFEGESADGQQLLVWAGSDVDPGQYYLFDRGTKQLRPLFLSRPELADYKLANVKSIDVRASDGAMIPAYLTLPPGSSGKGLPAIVMPHGGPGSRDEWGFDWLAQYYANRGYAVLQPNFRGSTGYGDAWFQNNGFQSWKIAIGDVVDSGKWLVSEGIADPKKLAIVGWSYGGYAALQSGVVAPDLYKAIVAIAPVTDLNDLKEQYRGWSNFVEAQRFIGSGPHIHEGSPAQNAAQIKSPVMLVHGELDLNVDVRASRLMESKLRAAGKTPQVLYYPGLDHQLDDSIARAEMLGKSDAFLRQSMGL